MLKDSLTYDFSSFSHFLFCLSLPTLQETIGRARCVDDVITAHDAYLSEVLDRALLAPHHEELNLQIQQLLHIVLRFCNLEETLIAGEILMNWFIFDV